MGASSHAVQREAWPSHIIVCVLVVKSARRKRPGSMAICLRELGDFDVALAGSWEGRMSKCNANRCRALNKRDNNGIEPM